MNLINLIKFGAAAVALLFAYWIGVQDGRDSEELKNARSQIVQLTATVKTYEAHYKNQQLRWPSCVFLNLLLGLTLTACAPASPVLKKEPRALPIETQFDVCSWEQSVDDYCKRFEDLLNTVEKRYSSK